MRVSELIQKLQECDPEAEIIFADEHYTETHIYSVYTDERQYGWALKPLPPKTKVVILSD